MRNGFPLRPDHGTEPLITAKAAYPEMERVVLGARRELLLGFRILDPETATRSAEARGQGLANWGALIADAVGRGVDVRILMTDFEPKVANDLHRMTWRAVAGFRDQVAAVDGAGQFEIIAALHEGELGKLIRWAFWPFVRMRVAKITSEAENHDGGNRLLRESPGLWRLVRRNGDGLSTDYTADVRLRPATYHQKMMVADGEVMIIGGLDIDERRYDDPDHDRAPEETWHDISLRVTGPVADDGRRHLIRCWNREVPRFNARLTSLGAPRDDLPQMATPIPVTRDEAGHEDESVSGESSVQLVRTQSKRQWSPFALGPTPAVTEIEQAHCALFETAREFVYIETQFFRSQPLSEALARAGRDNPRLRVVVVLPAAPEDVAFEGNTGPDARHGEWLQVRALDRLGDAFGDRLVVASLADRTDRSGNRRNGRAEEWDIIYVHAKVTIADAETAIVSSANLNGRSLKWDTEAGVVWRDRAAVARFQEELWQAHLRDGFVPDSSRDPDRALDMWRRATTDDAGPHGRTPQVVSYPLEDARSFARRKWFVPDNVV